MKQVIHFKDQELTPANKQILDSLTKDLSLDVTEVSNLDKLKSILNFLPDLDIVLIFINQASRSPTEVETLMQELCPEKPLVIVGAYATHKKNTHIVSSEDTQNSLKEIFNRIFYQNQISHEQDKLSAFVPVKFKLILEFSQTAFPVDFYLKIKQNAEEFQYVKRLNKNELFSKQELEKYQNHQLQNLFVRREQYADFLNFSIQLVKNSITQNEKSDFKNLNFSYHLSAESLALCGINQANVELVKQNIDEMVKNISSDSALVEYFKLMNANQLTYSYAHAYLISLFMSKVVQEFNWDSKAIKEKIVYIAFFHDISLPQDHLAIIHSMDEIDPKKRKNKHNHRTYTQDEIDKIEYHAANSGLILDQFPQVPTGVSQVVKEHHGSKNGIGFNENMNPLLLPLSILFIVIEEFVMEFLQIEKPTITDIENILKKLKVKFSSGSYRKSVDAFEKYLFSLRG